jgi:Protein of unknown function (DUF1761)
MSWSEELSREEAVMPEFGDINWLAVLAAVVAAQIIGFLWYGPIFGKAWMAATGKTQDQMGNTTPAMITGVVCSVLTAIALALMLLLSQTPEVVSGIKIGLVAAIGFSGATIVVNSVYQGTNRTVMWLAVGYQLVALTAMGAILGAMELK